MNPNYRARTPHFQTEFPSATPESTYDAVIVGAGFAGLCQARHLTLAIPGIKIALVELPPEHRAERDLAGGESLGEVTALFLGRELRLYDYLLEAHVPKAGSNFHWPKDVAKTEAIADYYHIWSNRQMPIATFHLERATFERDLLQVNKAAGVEVVSGRVIACELTAGDALKPMLVRSADGAEVYLHAKHLVDATADLSLLSQRADDLVGEPTAADTPNTGSVRVRVRHVDRDRFYNAYDPERASSSGFYATNHFFGKGHQLWMFPTDLERREIAIGMTYDREVIASDRLDSRAKLMAFLQANHTLLHDLIDAAEVIDFRAETPVPRRCQQVFSPDNWYVAGNAADASATFSSYGTSPIAAVIESITEIVRAKLAGDRDAETKRDAYNRFNLAYADLVEGCCRFHSQQLGHASIASWRIYLDSMLWFGMNVPLFVGKWHLHPGFIERFLQVAPARLDAFRADLHRQFDKLIDRGANLGFMDCYRADQLWGRYSTVKQFDNYLETAKFEPQRCNVLTGVKATYFYMAIWYLKFQLAGFGLKGLLAPSSLYRVARLLWQSFQTGIGERAIRQETRALPENSRLTRQLAEFAEYECGPELQPWGTAAAVSVPASVRHATARVRR